MPFAGVRFHAGDGSRAPGIHLLVDAELGAGLGAGGERDCGDEDASCADFPVAGGAYAGAGLGLRIDFFTPFVRARIQETTADGLPATTWGSAVAGFQFSAGEDFHLHLAAGWGGYWNDEDETVGPLGLLGFAVAWDAWPGGS